MGMKPYMPIPAQRAIRFDTDRVYEARLSGSNHPASPPANCGRVDSRCSKQGAKLMVWPELAFEFDTQKEHTAEQ
jgi:hypothetical protein